MPSRTPAYRQPPGGREAEDVSKAALRVARLLDRICRAPGQYAVLVRVPTHRRAPWQVDVYRIDKFSSLEILP
jgi:hypothetical protein